jgi:hypothetical protein
MNQGRLIFSQLLDYVPRLQFNKCVKRYRGNYKVQSFSCYDQFIALAFAQLTGRESLRDIVTCLQAVGSKLYHTGLRGKVSRSTLADANRQRDCRIYADFAQVLIAQARALYTTEDFGVDLQQTAYALDSTTIDICLSLFPWAKAHKHKGAIKLHTQMDLRGSIPCVIRVSDGKRHDVRFLDDLVFEPGAFYIMDKAYIDYERLYRMTTNMAYFVTRAKRNIDYARRDYRIVDKTTGLRSDQTIVLRGQVTSKRYPAPLRRVSFVDPDTAKRLVFLTNNFEQDALVIARLYKCRWQIELFFKWIKQHLRIKAFFGTSTNAVKTQIWVAVSVYVLVAIVKKEVAIDRSLYEILQILSILLFEKSPMAQALTHAKLQNADGPVHKQLVLFDL